MAKRIDAGHWRPVAALGIAKPQRAARNGDAKPGGDFNDDAPSSPNE